MNLGGVLGIHQRVQLQDVQEVNFAALNGVQADVAGQDGPPDDQLSFEGRVKPADRLANFSRAGPKRPAQRAKGPAKLC